MTEIISSAIIRALADEFEGAFEIYSGAAVEQGLREPCFFVQALEISQKALPGGRYLRRHSFDVHYFPPRTAAEGVSCGAVADRLFACLETVGTEPWLMRGTGMNHDTQDGVMHFYVNYNAIVKRGEVPEPMETMGLTLELGKN